jgi:anthranilate phosphoribosyltransferase
MKEILNNLFEYKSLNKDTAKEILMNLARGEYNNSQVASFLTVYLMRSITVDELEGFREAMLELCIPVDLSAYDPIDLCGTGGDGKDTFNISTLSSFLVAAAGQPVAKHGNNSVSSICGSSNILAHFGVKFSNDPQQLEKSIESSGICYLHAPLFHPAMKNVAPIRQELGIKTFFNMLGPMVNPAFVKKQLVGVFSLELARLYAYLYQRSGGQFAIIHALDGYDEISLTDGFKMITRQNEYIFHPEDLNLSSVNPEELYGGKDIENAAKIFLNILEGKGTIAQSEVVIANAGMSLYGSGFVLTVEEAIDKAREALNSGEALRRFKKFVNENKG